MLIYILSLSAAILLLLTLISISVYISYLIVSWFYGAPYVPTSMKEVEEMVKKLPVPKHATMIELGCGDGRVLRMFSKKYGVKGIGYDINPIVLTIARIQARFERLNVTFLNKDIRTVEMSQADIIYIFLFPKLIDELKDQILTKKKTAMIVSHGFKIPYLEHELLEVFQGKKFKTYIYKS